MELSTDTRYVLVVAGPTAVGKTDLCIELAQWLDTEVVSADSRQFFREMSIGTAKPTIAEQAAVRHHFIDSHSISELYSVGDFERDALSLLAQLHLTKPVVVLTGGSGLYLKAITEGLDYMPEAPLALREQLETQVQLKGLDPLLAQLQTLDPEYYASVDHRNHQRIVRAVEVCLSTGQPYSSFRQAARTPRPFECIKICLERPRSELYARIDARVEAMLAAGLINEVQQLREYRHHNALQTVGYKEVFEYLDGAYEYAEMLRLLQRNTRRYAKRQLTWFRNQDEFKWFDPSDVWSIKEWVAAQLGQASLLS